MAAMVSNDWEIPAGTFPQMRAWELHTTTMQHQGDQTLLTEKQYVTKNGHPRVQGGLRWG